MKGLLSFCIFALIIQESCQLVAPSLPNFYAYFTDYNDMPKIEVILIETSNIGAIKVFEDSTEKAVTQANSNHDSDRTRVLTLTEPISDFTNVEVEVTIDGTAQREPLEILGYYDQRMYYNAFSNGDTQTECLIQSKGTQGVAKFPRIIEFQPDSAVIRYDDSTSCSVGSVTTATVNENLEIGGVQEGIKSVDVQNTGFAVRFHTATKSFELGTFTDTFTSYALSGSFLSAIEFKRNANPAITGVRSLFFRVFLKPTEVVATQNAAHCGTLDVEWKSTYIFSKFEAEVVSSTGSSHAECSITPPPSHVPATKAYTYNCKVTSLHCHTDYTMKIRGLSTAMVLDYATEYSDASTSVKTGDGITVTCDGESDASMSMTIQQSALPGYNVAQTTGAGTGSDLATKYTQTELFYTTDYFHFTDKQNDVHGYLTKVAVGFDSGTKEITCIGLSQDTTLVDVSGSSCTANEKTFSKKITNLEHAYIASTHQCLKFTFEGGEEIIESDADACTSVAWTSLRPSNLANTYFLTNIATGDESGNLRIAAVWTSLNDAPELIQNSDSTLACSTTRDGLLISQYEFSLTASIKTEECGMSKDASSTVGSVVYTQKVTRVGDSPSDSIAPADGELAITRSNDFEISFQCNYDADESVEASFSTQKEADLKGTGHSKFEPEIALYNSEHYDVVATHFEAGSTLYYKVFLKNNVDAMIRATDCWVSKIADETSPVADAHFSIEEDACPTDTSGFQRLTSAGDLVDKLLLLVFQWADGGTDYYLHCKAYVCASNAASCFDDCFERRRRRAVTDPNAGVHHVVKHFTVSDSQKGHNFIARISGMNYAALGFVLVMATIIVVQSVRLYNRRIVYVTIKPEQQI